MTSTHEEREPQKQYETPEVTDYGRLADLTAGTADGCYLDADFPVMTKKSQLGFSGSC
jgi:hypothetical protein